MQNPTDCSQFDYSTRLFFSPKKANFPLIYIGINVSLILYPLFANAVKFFPSHRALSLTHTLDFVVLLKNHCSRTRCSRCHNERRENKENIRLHTHADKIFFFHFTYLVSAVCPSQCMGCTTVARRRRRRRRHCVYWNNNKKTLACDCFMIFVRESGH